MITPTTSSSAEQKETSSFNLPQTNRKNKAVKKTKKKNKKPIAVKKELDTSCYRNLCTRKITPNEKDTSINAFKTRTKIKHQTFEKEDFSIIPYLDWFPKKINDDINTELNIAYEELSRIFIFLEDYIYKRNTSYILTIDKLDEVIHDLISIKQEIIKIWKKHHPDEPYQYNGHNYHEKIKLEDRMLDFIQSQLHNCYSFIGDYKNKQLIINQLIEQKSISCFGLSIISTVANITNYEDIDQLNFKDILIKFTELEKLYTKFYRSENHDKNYKGDQLSVAVACIRLFIDKIDIDFYQINDKSKLFTSFVDIVGDFYDFYKHDGDYVKHIDKLSSGINYYLKNFDTPILNGIHNTLLTQKGIVFAEEFSFLLMELCRTTMAVEYDSKISQEYKKHDMLKDAIDIHNKRRNDNIVITQEKIKQLFIKYDIPTTNINSWYNTFIDETFIEIFYITSYMVVRLAELIDLAKKSKACEQVSKEKLKDIHTWLDRLTNNYKYFINDQIEWSEIPITILYLLYCRMTTETIRFSFGTVSMVKQDHLAMLFSQITQIFSPFLGTTLLAIANRDSCDNLLVSMDMLEYISEQTDKTKYTKSSQYLIAQIISYLIENNNKLDSTRKQLLFTKAEKIYLDIASSGTPRAYLFLAETTAIIAKIKMHDNSFLEAINLYDKASNYCQTLSDVEFCDTELKEIALITKNCFSAEAGVLRKINEEENALIQELAVETKPTTKKMKKLRKQPTDITPATDKQELATEITTEELIDWQKTYATTNSKIQKSTAVKAKTTSSKVTLVKTLATAVKPESRADIEQRVHFYNTLRILIPSSGNVDISYKLLIELMNNNYFKILESQINKEIIQKDTWLVLLVYQSLAYHHFLQLKNAKEIGYTENLKLFYFANSKKDSATKANKVTSEQIIKEAQQIIRHVIKLTCTNIEYIDTKNIRGIILSLSNANYSDLPQNYRNQLAAISSTYGHLTSLDDIALGRRGKLRLCSALYDKANEINPNRLIKKHIKQEAS